MYKICEGIHIGDVTLVSGEKVKSLIWQPRGKNWLAQRLWWLITKEEEDGGQEQTPQVQRG